MTQVAYQHQTRRAGVRPTRRWLYDHAKFFARKAFSELRIPDQPFFDHACTEMFEQMLRDSELYIEYGSGGSTILAATLGKSFISVESDLNFSNALRGRLHLSGRSDNVVGVNIGATGAWGAPLFTSPNEERLKLWRNYITAPWSRLAPGILPDLILVDGRFRVACALYSLMQLHEKPAATILVDDYAYRPHFHIVEEFARLERKVGRMAIFHPDPGIPRVQIEAAFERYVVDWR